jgi:hypothetical protein
MLYNGKNGIFSLGRSGCTLCLGIFRKFYIIIGCIVPVFTSFRIESSVLDMSQTDTVSYSIRRCVRKR